MNFGHRKAAGQFERANVFQVFFVVLFGAKKVDTHAPKPKLNPKLYHQTQIMIAQRFHNGEVRSHIVLSTEFFWISNGSKTLIGQHVRPLQNYMASYFAIM